MVTVHAPLDTGSSGVRSGFHPLKSPAAWTIRAPGWTTTSRTSTVAGAGAEAATLDPDCGELPDEREAATTPPTTSATTHAAAAAPARFHSKARGVHSASANRSRQVRRSGAVRSITAATNAAGTDGR